LADSGTKFDDVIREFQKKRLQRENNHKKIKAKRIEKLADAAAYTDLIMNRKRTLRDKSK